MDPVGESRGYSGDESNQVVSPPCLNTWFLNTPNSLPLPGLFPLAGLHGTHHLSALASLPMYHFPGRSSLATFTSLVPSTPFSLAPFPSSFLLIVCTAPCSRFYLLVVVFIMEGRCPEDRGFAHSHHLPLWNTQST